MFGYTVAEKTSLGQEETAVLAASYCGLCQQLRQDFGSLSAAATTYDVLLLIVLIAAQRAADVARGGDTRCPLSAYLRTCATLGDHEALGYGAAITVLLASEKFRDSVRDEATLLHAVALRFMRGPLRRAKDILGSLGFPLERVQQIRDEQHMAESTNLGSLQAFLEPTGLAVSTVFAHTAMIAGNQRNGPVLAALGSSVGRVVALADACEDLHRDCRRRAYNPIRALWQIDGFGRVPVEVMRRACTVTALEFHTIETCLRRLALSRLGPLIRNMLTVSLPKRTCLALGRLWRNSHWQGEIPRAALPAQGSACLCPTCGFPHLPGSDLLPDDKGARALWLLGSLVEGQDQLAREIGFGSVGDYLLANALPSIAAAASGCDHGIASVWRRALGLPAVAGRHCYHDRTEAVGS